MRGLRGPEAQKRKGVMVYCGAFPKGSCVGSLASSATVWRGGQFKRAASWDHFVKGPMMVLWVKEWRVPLVGGYYTPEGFILPGLVHLHVHI